MSKLSPLKQYTFLTRKFRQTIILFMGLMLVFLPAACNQTEVVEMPVRDRLVTFQADVDTNEAGEVTLDLFVHNGGKPLPADEATTASWQLRRGNDDVRAGGNAYGFPALPGGQETNMVSWRGKLAPNTYTLTWGAPGYGAAVVTFTVSESADGLKISDQEITHTGDYPPPVQ